MKKTLALIVTLCLLLTALPAALADALPVFGSGLLLVPWAALTLIQGQLWRALGLMFLNRRENSMKPLVYVPAAGTLFWEASCASGTTAVGAFTAAETGRHVDLALMQPGGTLRIQASPDGPLHLCGRVRILK